MMSSTLKDCFKNREIICSWYLTSALFLNGLMLSPVVFKCPFQLGFVLSGLSSHSFEELVAFESTVVINGLWFKSTHSVGPNPSISRLTF